MTLTIHLLSEVEDALRDRASAEGISVEHYARRVLERHLGAGASPPEEPAPAPATEAAPFEPVTRVHNMPPGAFDGLRRDPKKG